MLLLCLAPYGRVYALVIAVTVNASLSQQGYSEGGIAVNAKPRNNLLISDVAYGCVVPGSSDTIAAAPVFQGQGVAIGSLQFINHPQVVVFGWNTQPLLLPSNGTQPCLLVPTPDVLIASFSMQQFSIPLPAAIRPFQFWCQTVHLVGNHLRPSNCIRVSAY